MSAGPDLSSLSHAQKDALIAALKAQVASLTARVAELEAKLGLPPKTPDNSSVPPSKDQKRSEGIVMLPLDEREVSAPQELSSRCDGGPPRGHRDSAKRGCVWAEMRWRWTLKVL